MRYPHKFLGAALFTALTMLGITGSAFAEGPALSSLDVPPDLISGHDHLGKVTLTGAAPAAGAIVTLGSDKPLVAHVPSATTVPSGATFAPFLIKAGNVGDTQIATITATYNGVTKQGQIHVHPAALDSLVGDGAIYGGNLGTAVVELNGSAGPAGALVHLSSDNPNLHVDGSVLIPAEHWGVSFHYKTLGVDSAQTATLTATYRDVTKHKTISILPATLDRLIVDPAHIVGGRSEPGFLTLRGAAGPAGLTVDLHSDSEFVIVPATAGFEPQAHYKAFVIRTRGVTHTVNATITAKLGDVTKTAPLRVDPAVLDHLGIPDHPVIGGNPAEAYVALNGAAGTGGDVIALKSDNTDVATVPASVTILQDAFAREFHIGTKGVNERKIVTIEASFGGITKTNTLTVDPASLYGILADPHVIVGGHGSSLIVHLNGAAGPGGVTVQLSSDNAAAMVPATVLIPAGHWSNSAPITTATVQSNQTVNLTAVFGSVTKHTVLTINAA